MVKKIRKKSAAKQRIIETAERLFYAEGLRSVGIDRIIAEADVAKMTLYNHFPSKDDLILAVLQYREGVVDDSFRKWMDKHMANGANPLEAFFGALRNWFETPGFRGCSFINAAVELADPTHQASQFAVAHKERFQKMIGKAMRDSGCTKAASLAPAILLLVEGAIVAAVMQQSSKPATVARKAALALVEQA